MSRNTIAGHSRFSKYVSNQFIIFCEYTLNASWSLIIECEIVRNVKIVIEITRDYDEFMKIAKTYGVEWEFIKKKKDDYTSENISGIHSAAGRIAHDTASCVAKFVYNTNGKCLEAAKWYKDHSVEYASFTHIISMKVCDSLLNSNLEDRHLPPFSIGYWK